VNTAIIFGSYFVVVDTVNWWQMSTNSN